MLFFVAWPDRVSLLVDADDDAAARAIASSVADGSAPASVRPFVGVFAAEVFLDEDDAGEDLIVVEPLDYVSAALRALEDASTDAPADNVIPFPASPCGFELEDEDGAVLECRRARHDDDRHEAIDARGELVEWHDAGG